MIDRLFRLLNRRTGIAREEASSAFLMALYFFLAMSTVSIVKAVQNAVYLGRVGFDWKLPSLYLVLALVSMAIVAFLGRVAHRVSRLTLNLSTLVGLTLLVLVFLFLLNREWAAAYPLFYVFGGILSVLVPTQGWMLSYELFSYRQAKRLFSFLGTGGILGGASGGYYAAGMASWGVDSQWLLVHAGVLLLCLQALLLFLRCTRISQRGSDGRAYHTEQPEKPVLALRSSSYLKYLAGLVLMSACLATLIDLQYKWVLEEKYAGSPSSIAQFFGYLLGTMFVVSALLQLAATSRMVRRFGVAVTTMALPAALLLGSIPVILWATFVAVVAVKVIDGSLRSSLFKTTTELLFIPVFNEGTVAVKGFIDLVVFRIGDALAAGIFLALLSLGEGPIKLAGGAMIVIAAIWLLFAQKLSIEYLAGLRSSLESEAVNPAVHLDVTLGADAESSLVTALQSDNPRKLRFALRELVKRMPERREAELSTTERDSAVYHLYRHEPPSWLPKVERALEHDDQEIVAGALRLLVGYDPEKYRDLVDDICPETAEPSLLCLTYLDRFAAHEGRQVKPDQLLDWSRKVGPEEKRVLASLMGKDPQPELKPILMQWARSEDHRLARAALRVLGRYQSEELFPFLLDYLNRDWSREVARHALAEYADDQVPRLADLARRPGTPPEVQREIPRILTRIGTPTAQEALLSLLYVSDPLVSYRALKGLNKIRKDRKLVFGEASLLPILQVWAQHHYELLNLQQVLGKSQNREEKLLQKTVEERLHWSTEKIFRALELFLPPGDAYFSYLGFTGDDPSLRENAVELLDMRVKGEIRKTVLPILAGRDPKHIARQGRRIFNLSSDFDQVVSDALFTADPWLKCCIIAFLRQRQRDSLKARVRTATEDVNPVVRETARWALEAWAG